MPSPEKSPTDPSAGANPAGKCSATATTCPTLPPIPKECAFLNKGHLVSGTEKQFDRNRKPAKVGPGKDIKYTFPGDTAPSDATEYEVEVDGRKVKVIVPKPYPPGKNLPSVEEIAKGLGAVPSGQLSTIKQVVVSPNPNPDDAYWAKEYNKPGFQSAATGGASGVTMYPTTNKLDQSRVDSNLIHEGGHTYAGDLWKDADKKKAWEKAMKDDPFSPSTYADSSAGEDLSESMVMYSLSKGTPCEAIAKQMYPERYKILDQLSGK